MSLINPPIYRDTDSLYGSRGISLSNVIPSNVFGGHPVINTTSIYPSLLVSTMPMVEVNTGLNENPFAQQQTTDYVRWKFLDKWLYDELCHLLKYLVITNGKVSVISSINEYDGKTDECNETIESIEAKADFLEENILTINATRKALTLLATETGLKWYNFASKQYEPIVIKYINRVVKRKLREMIPDAPKK